MSGKEYTYFNSCRSCGSREIKHVADLGRMPLAGGFIPRSVKKIRGEKRYPLQLVFCKKCALVQVNISIRPDTLFKYYYYRSSVIATLVRHFEGIAARLAKKFGEPKKRFVVEIGCNDGSFIKALRARGFRALGVDPARNLVQPLIKKGMPILNTYFTEKLARSIAKEEGKADVIFSSNTLAHVEDINDVFAGIAALLKDDGQLIFEVHYLGSLLKETQYDMVYHEHQYYYSALSVSRLLRRHGLELFDAELIPIHAGSVRFYAQKNRAGKRLETARLRSLRKKERHENYGLVSAYEKLDQRIRKSREDLIELLEKLKKNGKRIAGYGASGRATIISNYCGLGRFLDYCVDDSPLKQGTRMPGVHLPVVSANSLYGRKAPDYVVLFAWAFSREIVQKHKKFVSRGGRFIVPLPHVRFTR